MASNINFTSIDETYPIAGQDNDTQGFRDNFGFIKNNFEAAKSEIEDLQLNTARTDENSDFNNNNLLKANFVQCSEEFYDGGVVTSTTLVDRTVGSYHKYQLNTVSVVQFTLTGWSTSGTYSSMRVHLSSDGTTRTATFALPNAGVFLKDAGVPNPITVTSAAVFKIFEFWTFDGGNTVYMKYLGEFS